MKKKLDVFAQKKAELNTYVAQFEDAISMVTSTIDSLGAINDNINAKIREIDDYEAELAKTKEGLADAKSKNERVIKNFSALLNVD